MESLRISENASEQREHEHGLGRNSRSQKPLPPSLRKPHQITIENQIAGISSTNTNQPEKRLSHHEEVVRKSKLSADAKEFVPKSIQPSPAVGGRPSVQDRLLTARNMSRPTATQNQLHAQPQLTSQMNSDYSYESPQIFHQQRQSEQHSDYANHYHTNNSTTQGNDDEYIELMATMEQLGNAMHSLTLHPGMYQFLVPPLVKSILSHLDSPSHFQGIISAIIQQSINESNFRYSGARLCKSLDTAAKPNKLAAYRDILCSMCHDNVQSQARTWQETKEHSDEEQKRCHGLILFLAELVVQMEDPCLPLGEQLIRLINIILKKPAPNTAKHVCQALKLAGHALETNNTGSRSEMECMMRALTELVTQGHVDSHVGRMVNSVNELRNGNWGQSTTNYAPVNIDAASIAKTQPDDPVFYGPDGNVLSLEESQFLNDLAQEENDSEDSSYLHKDGQITDDEEDDLIASAYEEFLKTIPKKN